jgi:hypothetical protein
VLSRCVNYLTTVIHAARVPTQSSIARAGYLPSWMAATAATCVPDSRATYAAIATGVMTRETFTVTSTLLVVCVEVSFDLDSVFFPFPFVTLTDITVS